MTVLKERGCLDDSSLCSFKEKQFASSNLTAITMSYIMLLFDTLAAVAKVPTTGFKPATSGVAIAALYSLSYVG